MTAAPIRALIVDDEPLARANLRHALLAFPRWRIEAECPTTSSARSVLEQSGADVVFLDIRMPCESGIEFARGLADEADPPIVVFVTAYDAFALEAFELHALDYLLKPFDDERMASAVRRAESLLDLHAKAAYGTALRDYVHDSSPMTPPAERGRLTRLTVRSVGRIESVQVGEILWIATAGNYVELHLCGRTVLHRVTLTLLEQRLDPGVFIRTHRSAMVRVDQCVSLTVEGDGQYLLALKCGAHAPVSERYVDGVRRALGVRVEAR